MQNAICSAKRIWHIIISLFFVLLVLYPFIGSISTAQTGQLESSASEEISLLHLANSYRAKGDYDKAETIYKRALLLRESRLGPDHPDIASPLNSLALLYYSKEDYANAELLYSRVLTILKKNLNPDNSEIAQSLNNLAAIYYIKEYYDKAEGLLQESLRIREKLALPDKDKAIPRRNIKNLAIPLNNLALLYLTKGDTTQAIAFQSRANEIVDRFLFRESSHASENEKISVLNRLSAETDRTISMNVQSSPDNLDSRRLALLTILRRKGYALDDTTYDVNDLRVRIDSAHDLLNQLAYVRSRIAMIIFGRPSTTNPTQRQTGLETLEERAEDIEKEISERAVYGPPIVTLKAILGEIPSDTMLIEFALYHPFNARSTKQSSSFGEPRYVAYVIAKQGDPKMVDLGEAKYIDIAVTAFRKAIRDPNRSDVVHLARTLDEKIMQPIRKLLGRIHNILLSPDGLLNLIPFGALLDEQSQFLVKRYSFTYLSSGRELLRLRGLLSLRKREKIKENRAEAVIVANPNFGDLMSKGSNRDLKHQTSEESTSAIDLADFSYIDFTPLPGTEEEALRLKEILPNAIVLMDEQATESAVKQVDGPKILHIATHGFFFEDAQASSINDERGLRISTEASSAMKERKRSPLLRSGLILAGANLRKSGSEDGVLSALEVASLNLLGTKLVVLSACDTGIGEVKNAEGVYGLRRALAIAGSESQVISLWQVNDLATRDLMVDYYKGLQAGQGRTEALRQAQLVMLQNKARSHPYYWACFINSGEWANLDSKRSVSRSMP